MIVEMLSMPQSSAHTGIGRYWYDLQKHFPANLQVRPISPKYLPAVRQFTFLQSFPVGYLEHQNGNLLHFPQIMGCSAMLINPVHPSVVTVHDLGSLILPDEKKMLDPIGRLFLHLSLAGLRRTDRIICVSEFTRQSVIQHLHLPADQVVTIPSGIDMECFHPVQHARSKIVQKYPQLNDHAGPWLLYVGSELPRKNLSVLWEALAVLRVNHPNLLLIKIGAPGGDRFRQASIQAIRALNLEDVTFFNEGITNSDLALFYNAADLLVHPSKLEGFGFPVLEAMACGTPVVCADAGSLPEVSGGAAFLAPPEDVATWVNKIELLLNSPDLYHELQQKSLSNANKYSWNNTSTATFHLYHKLVSS